MYYRLNKKQIEEIKRVSKITLTDYQLLADFIDVENLFVLIEDILKAYDSLEDEYTEFKNFIDGNYIKKEINRYEELGIRESDFH